MIVACLAGVLELLANDVITQLNAFVADKDGRTRD
jgi:hypothetical protein